MLRLLYRASMLGLLVYCASTLIDMKRDLTVLRVLAKHPLVLYVPSNLSPDIVQRLKQHLKGSSPGGAVVLPWPFETASPAATTEPSAAPVSTEEPGRWTPTSGRRTAEAGSHGQPIMRAPHNRTSLPTEAGSTEAGSPGPVLGSLGLTPKHDHSSRVACVASCPAWFAVQREKIVASGHAAICMPGLRYPLQDCARHPHVPGEKLDGR